MAGLFDWLIEKGLATKFPQETWAQQPTNRRVFLESVLGGDRSPITEKNLTKEEIEYLSKKWQDRVNTALETSRPIYERAKRDLASGSASKSTEDFIYGYEEASKGRYTPEWLKWNKDYDQFTNSSKMLKLRQQGHGYLADPNFGYQDYNTASGKGIGDRSTDYGRTPDEVMETLLGKYRVYMNRQGKPMIMDNYDFNPNLVGGSGNSEVNTGQAQDAVEVGDTSGLYDAIRAYAGGKMPPGKGRAVSIKLKDIYNK